MEQIFSAIVGTDNQKRAEAEKEFEAMCDSHTVETTESLLKSKQAETRFPVLPIFNILTY